MHLEDFRGHIRWEEGSQTPLTFNFSLKEKKQNDNWVGGFHCMGKTYQFSG